MTHNENIIRQNRIKEAAERALKEAEQRRNEHVTRLMPREINGARGPEPTRYDDWEKKGIICDF